MKVVMYVDGIPQPRQSVRFTRAGVSYQPKNKAHYWKEHVSLVAKTAMAGKELLDGVLEVHMTFYMPHNKASTKEDRHYHTVTPDLDNLEKPVNDAMEKIVFTNDSRIAKKNVMKLYGENPGVFIEIKEIECSR